MKSLPFLLDKIAEKSLSISDVEILNITNNSRDVTKNTLFLAYKGEKSDGRHYITQAIEKGAAAICYEPSDDFILPETKIPCIAVENLKIKQSNIAARFYDFPSQKIPVIGVTGTNGKTSITHFIAQCLDHCGVIGTIGYGFLPDFTKTANTTPDGLQLQKIFAELIDHGAQSIAMEVSSHALSQQRVNNIDFDTAVFTNLTQDHLDFHRTMENYRDAKELLFSTLAKKNAVINIDDDAGKYFAQKYSSTLNVITYAIHNKTADICVEKCTPTENGFDLIVKTPTGTLTFYCPLIGEFNISNVLAVIGVLQLQNLSLTNTAEKIAQLKTVNGRMQLIAQKNKPRVIIDYAHTPDALEKALQSVRSHCAGKLWCVFGCGGDRDKTKRPQMGLIADRLADQVIITNDNPRSELGEQIAKDILDGTKNKNKFLTELDRAKAIAQAIQSADKNDWILIAGKGHETEQIIGEKISHHNDSECALRQLECRSSDH